MAYRRTLAEARQTLDLAIQEDQAGELHRELCLNDLWFLLVFGCRRIDLDHQWFLDRCDEVYAEPDGFLDLWAREHGKSSIITFGKTLQDILRDPEISFGIFSHTRPMAKAFLRTTKRELESNQYLKTLFPTCCGLTQRRKRPSGRRTTG